MTSLQFFAALLLAQRVSSQKPSDYLGPASSSYFVSAYNSPNFTASSLTCDSGSIDNLTTNSTPVQYYNISVNEAKYASMTITTCCDDVYADDGHGLYCNESSLDTNLYVLYTRKKRINLISVSGRRDDTECISNGEKPSIVVDALSQDDKGHYIVAIGGYAQQYGPYHMSVTCSKHQKYHVLRLLVPLGLIILMLCASISCAWRYRYKRSKQSRSISDILFQLDTYGAMMDNDLEKGSGNPNDGIAQELQDSIDSLKDEDGLDIYQVLAVRWLDKGSKKWRVNQKGCCDLYLPPSRYYTLFMAFIAAVIQTFGLTAIIFYCFIEYTEFKETFCRSSRQIHTFILSILLTLVITITVSVVFKNIQGFGLYKLINHMTYNHGKSKELDEMSKRISIPWLYIGQAINGYACLLCAIGSYLVTFQSEESVDMILNCMALYFIVEIDNAFVSPRAYRECSAYLESLLEMIKNMRECVIINDQGGCCYARPCLVCAKRGQHFSSCVQCLIFLLGFAAPFFQIPCLDI